MVESETLNYLMVHLSLSPTELDADKKAFFIN